MLKSMKDYIIATIQRAFEVAAELADGLFSELMQCVENKHLVSKTTDTGCLSENSHARFMA